MAQKSRIKDIEQVRFNSAEYIHGDASNSLDTLIEQGKKFKLIMTSPPYNMDKEYEKTRSLDSYKTEIELVIARLAKVLDDNGSICWQVGNYIDPKTKEVVPLDIFYHQLFKDHKLILRNRIIWHFEHGFHANNRFSGRYETIMWYTKSQKYIFNLDPVRVPAKYPGKRYYKGNKKGQISGNPKGKNPSDVWKVIKSDWEREIWEIPNVKANHKEKTTHPCQYPVELVERCVLALTNENDWVLDPFAGVGSTMIAAIKNQRNSIGIEKYKKYIRIGEKRLQSYKKGTLDLRQLGKPVFIPNPNMSVAQKPDYFQY